MTPQVVNAHELSRKTKIPHATLQAIIKKHAVPVVFEHKHGKGKVRYFDKFIAEQAVKSHLAEQAAKIKPASSAPLVAEPGASLSALTKLVSTMDVSVQDTDTRTEQISLEIGMLKEQNRLIMKQLCDTHKWVVLLAKEFKLEVLS